MARARRRETAPSMSYRLEAAWAVVTVPLSALQRGRETPQARAMRAQVRWRRPWRGGRLRAELRRSCRRELRPPTGRCRRSRATETKTVLGVGRAAWASAPLD